MAKGPHPCLLLLLLSAPRASCRRLQAPSFAPEGLPSNVNGSLPPLDSLSNGTIPPNLVAEAEAALGQLEGQINQEEYGEFHLPVSYDAVDDAGQPNCGIALNATGPVCDDLISTVLSNSTTCDCYNFCDGRLAGCYDYGATPPLFDCPIADLVLGCRANFSRPVYNVTAHSPSPCPPGYMCSRDSQQLCEVIRAIPLIAKLGDVHAGMYCPGSEDRTKDNGYKICEVGYYCPNSTTKKLCPEGRFCPHKTLEPEIICSACEVGATSLQREQYGYIVVGIALGLCLCFLLWWLLVSRNKNLQKTIAEMQYQSLYSMQSQDLFGARKKKLLLLKPKLKVIESRMKSMSSVSVSGLSTERADGNVEFDASKLFDALDLDRNGELSYKELNMVLKLQPAGLREFTNRMNQAGRAPPGTNTISRPVFTRFFLSALAVAGQFEPTPEESAQLYDQLAAEAENEKFSVTGGIPHEAFYKCNAMAFLTETQINELLSLFELYKAADERIVENDSEASDDGPRRQMKKRQSIFFGSLRFARRITRNEFVARYPNLLLQVTDGKAKVEKEGVDIAFENLCLAVRKGDQSVLVVNDITGRLRSGTMTALMGGSGAGKTSLLNALCGRAHYGEVTGTIKINGQRSTIEEHADSVGFVPQDDIVYAELTVRENLIYSGKFQLPRGTTLHEIEDLADKSLASLGLSRVQHNMVGDVNRRGVSGGEKKRVNIGLELMSRPKILFLDEPTSGLDSSSAMLVMQSMKNLVERNGITVCSVIHQPRKTIFELFDSLVLLGAGGFMVYHGQVGKAQKYFWNLGYDLPQGESLADWLIDISTGSLKPEVFDDESDGHHDRGKKASKENKRKDNLGDVTSDEEFDNHDGIDGNGLKKSAPNDTGGEEDPEMLATDAEKEAARREFLYKSWRNHFKRLSNKETTVYMAPEPFELPSGVNKPRFLSQLGFQVHRLVLLAWRNWYAKAVDTTVIVGAVILISLMDGVVQPTIDAPMNDLDYYALAKPSGTLLEAGEALVREFPKLFKYAILANNKIVLYAAKLGVLIAVLVGLTATKTITEKRNEFFREAGSGYDINAYFVAVNIVTTVEHSIQVMLSSMFALWLRNSLNVWYSYYLNFLLLAWICVSWSLLFSVLVQPKTVVLLTGFYFIFFSLLFSGGTDPIKYKKIYGSDYVALFSGFMSPTRYFIEAMAASESRCLPVQSGFTNLGERLLTTEGADQVASFMLVSQGLNDFGTVTTQACDGWYWGMLPAFVVGFTVRWLAGGVNHLSGRPQQSKKPILTTLRQKGRSQIALVFFLLILSGSIAVAEWLILRKVS